MQEIKREVQYATNNAKFSRDGGDRRGNSDGAPIFAFAQHAAAAAAELPPPRGRHQRAEGLVTPLALVGAVYDRPISADVPALMAENRWRA